MTDYTAFLPCRLGSERVKRKNTRDFGGIKGGLTRIKLEQLTRVPELSKILVSTNDPEVVEIAEDVRSSASVAIEIVPRPDHLGRSQTTTDDLIIHLAEIAPPGVLVWTHTTSPFVDQSVYSSAIKAYEDNVLSGPHDSLMSVVPIRSFLWSDIGPVNYDRGVEKWPRTQTLPVYYEINSAIFICDRSVMQERRDRIGASPYKFSMNHIHSTDIDWEGDFTFAEKLGMVLAQDGRSGWW